MLISLLRPQVVHTRTCDGLGVPAVGRRQACVKLGGLALAHILLLVGVPPVGLRVWIRVQVWGRGQGRGRGGQLGSPLTGGEKKGPWASGAGAPLGDQVQLTDRRQQVQQPGEEDRKMETIRDRYRAIHIYQTHQCAFLHPYRVFNFKCCC